MKRGNKAKSSGKKKIWIDLDNSPHVPFFKPIIEELNNHGYQVMLTARDCFQTCGLADLFHLEYKRIGKHYGRHKIIKVAGLVFRAFQLMPAVRREKPDLALSHGSRAQLISAAMLGIPSVVIFDYEYATMLPLAQPKWVVVPEIIPDNAIKLPRERIYKYPGIKEDVYVPNFRPDFSVKRKLGLNEEDIVVTIRPPATEAHYHNPHSEELFETTINFLGNRENTRLVLLPRNEKQEDKVRKMWPEFCSNSKIIIPEHVIDGLNLMWYSDLVISGGGTMNREAAALGVPVYSIFRGKIGAVDQYLANNGRLILLENLEDVKTKVILERWQRPESMDHGNNATLQSIVASIISVIEKS